MNLLFCGIGGSESRSDLITTGYRMVYSDGVTYIHCWGNLSGQKTFIYKSSAGRRPEVIAPAARPCDPFESLITERSTLEQKQNWCNVRHCRQVAFSSRKSRLAPSRPRHANSALALARENSFARDASRICLLESLLKSSISRVLSGSGYAPPVCKRRYLKKHVSQSERCEWVGVGQKVMIGGDAANNAQSKHHGAGEI